MENETVTTTATMEEMKAEAISRMRLLKLFPQVIEQFEQDSLVNISERPFGAHFHADKQLCNVIKDIEKEYNILVYTGIRSHSNLGETFELLYVTSEKETWEQNRKDLETKSPYAYVYNRTAPDCSEFGPVGIEATPAAGLKRTW